MGTPEAALDRKAYKKAWYEANKKRVLEEAKQRYAENREKINRQKSEYYKRNKAAANAKAALYRDKNAHRISEWHANNYANNAPKIKERVRGYRAANRNKIWALNLKKYGITTDQYTEMLEKQQGMCAICGDTHNRGKRLCVDHCHKTGKIRGLLCLSCNIMLGNAIDSPATLRAGAQYLEERT